MYTFAIANKHDRKPHTDNRMHAHSHACGKQKDDREREKIELNRMCSSANFCACWWWPARHGASVCFRWRQVGMHSAINWSFYAIFVDAFRSLFAHLLWHYFWHAPNVYVFAMFPQDFSIHHSLWKWTRPSAIIAHTYIVMQGYVRKSWFWCLSRVPFCSDNSHTQSVHSSGKEVGGPHRRRWDWRSPSTTTRREKKSSWQCAMNMEPIAIV